MPKDFTANYTVSLKYRIAATIFFLETLMMALVLWQTLSANMESTRKHLNSNEAVIMDLLSELSRSSLLTTEYSELQPYLEKAIQAPEIYQIILSNRHNRIVASSMPEQIGKSLLPMKTDSSSFWRNISINNASGKLGQLSVLFSTKRIQQSMEHIRNLGISIALMGMVFIALISTIMGTVLTRRLEYVARTTQELEKTNWKIRCKVSGKDEIAHLALNINTMADKIEQTIKSLQNREKDLTQLNRELEQRVLDRTKTLELINKELEAFASSVSHDLRVPLRAIAGFSEILMTDHQEQIDEQGQDYLLRINTAANRMGQLINDLLNLSRISRSKMHIQAVDLSAMVWKTTKKLQEDKAEITAEIVVQEGVIVQGDKNLLQIAIDNLISNAWKYSTKKNKINIEFNAFKQNDGWVYCIRDQGDGFDMLYADQLFVPFQRLHSNDEFEGIGVGLATVKRVIDRHSGRIWAESNKGQGACFYFTING